MILTLDLDLQAVAEESLASTIQSIKERGQRNHTSGWDVEGGAAVVIDIDTGGILACASYPSYNLATFNQDYQMLYDDPLKPMFNRATMGAYPPGSTFKPVTALAALESGTVTLPPRSGTKAFTPTMPPAAIPLPAGSGTTSGALTVFWM